MKNKFPIGSLIKWHNGGEHMTDFAIVLRYFLINEIPNIELLILGDVQYPQRKFEYFSSWVFTHFDKV